MNMQELNLLISHVRKVRTDPARGRMKGASWARNVVAFFVSRTITYSAVPRPHRRDSAARPSSWSSSGPRQKGLRRHPVQRHSMAEQANGLVFVGVING